MANRPQVRPDLQSLDGYHSAQVNVDIRLNTNEAPKPPPEEFSQRVAAAISDLSWNRYPDRSATELRRKIAALHSVEPSQIFVANGSNEVLQTVLLTYAGAGRRTLTFEPTYSLHSHLSRITGSEPVSIDRDDDFEISAERSVAAVHDLAPAVTFICNPNNPTGLIEPPETVRALLEAVEQTGGLLVVDEAYGQFADWSALEILGPESSMVITRTFSKTWAMAGARLGYLIAPEWLVAELEKVVLPYHLDMAKQAAGVIALDFVDEMEEMVAVIVEERVRIEAELRDLGARVWPSGSNFVLFRPPGGNGREVWQELVERSILVRDTSSWDHLAGCLRVTIGTKEENSAFRAALSEIVGEP